MLTPKAFINTGGRGANLGFFNLKVKYAAIKVQRLPPITST
ncbi:unnamed protein product, partial [marine sediment metagenome]